MRSTALLHRVARALCHIVVRKMTSLPIHARDMATASAPPGLILSRVSHGQSADRSFVVRNTFIEVDTCGAEDESPPRGVTRRSSRTRTAPAECLRAIDVVSEEEDTDCASESDLNHEANCEEDGRPEEMASITSEASTQNADDDCYAGPYIYIPTPVTRRHCGASPRCFARPPPFFDERGSEKPPPAVPGSEQQPLAAPMASEEPRDCLQQVLLHIPLQVTYSEGQNLPVSSEVPVSLGAVRSSTTNGRTVVNIQVFVGSEVPPSTAFDAPDVPATGGELMEDGHNARTRCEIRYENRHEFVRSRSYTAISSLTAASGSSCVSSIDFLADRREASPLGSHISSISTDCTNHSSEEVRRVRPNVDLFSALSADPVQADSLPPCFKGFPSQMVCCHWKNKGWCKYQSSCRFQHPAHKQGIGGATGVPGKR